MLISEMVCFSSPAARWPEADPVGAGLGAGWLEGTGGGAYGVLGELEERRSAFVLLFLTVPAATLTVHSADGAGPRQPRVCVAGVPQRARGRALLLA